MNNGKPPSRFKTPLLIGAALVAVEILVSATFYAGAPAGQKWLGDTLVFPGDAAVYLSYLEQGAQGNAILSNLFAIEPHARRVDPYWSTLGLIARTGIPPLVLFEASRWLMTFILAFALFAAVRRGTENVRDAGFIAWIATFGAGLGWLYTFWIYAFGEWRIDTPFAADVGSEFAVFPTIFCGSHMILSIALLITSLRLAWTGLTDKQPKACILSALSAGLLLSFHPYFLPLFGIFCALSLAANRRQADKRLAVCAAILATAAIPALCLYLPLYFDQTFKTHHLTVNYLPLAPALSWAFTLTPFAIALAWRWRKGLKPDPKEYWLIAWIASAAICLVIPLPWKRKFLEGISIALVMLAAPLLVHIRGWMTKSANPWMRGLAVTLVVFGLGLGSFQLLASQIAWANDRDKAVWFYRPTGLFEAWKHLKQASDGGAVAVADDLYANIFTPAFAGRKVVVGHDHETPEFGRKLDDWRSGLTRGRPEDTLPYLQGNSITHLLLTKPETQEKISPLLEAAGWRKSFDLAPVAIWTAPGI